MPNGWKSFSLLSSKEGRKSLAYQGSREVDVYAVFFDKKEYENFKLSKEDAALLKEKEDAAKKEKEGDDKKSDKSKTEK